MSNWKTVESESEIVDTLKVTQHAIMLPDVNR